MKSTNGISRKLWQSRRIYIPLQECERNSLRTEKRKAGVLLLSAFIRAERDPTGPHPLAGNNCHFEEKYNQTMTGKRNKSRQVLEESMQGRGTAGVEKHSFLAFSLGTCSQAKTLTNPFPPPSCNLLCKETENPAKNNSH